MENTGKTVEYPFLWGKVVEIPARRSVMRPMDPAKGAFCMNKKQKKNLQRIIIALILVLILKPQFPMPVELVLHFQLNGHPPGLRQH